MTETTAASLEAAVEAAATSCCSTRPGSLAGNTGFRSMHRQLSNTPQELQQGNYKYITLRMVRQPLQIRSLEHAAHVHIVGRAKSSSCAGALLVLPRRLSLAPLVLVSTGSIFRL